MDRRLAAVVAFYVVVAGLGLLWMAARGDPLPAALLAERVSWIAAAGGGAATAVAVVLVSDLLLERFAWTDLLRRDVVQMLGPVTVGRAATVALASGIGEEILFRGALLPWAGLVVSSIVFGVLHAGPRLLGWTAFAIVGGFVFGGLAVWSGGVLAPAVAHVGINGAQLLRLRRSEH